MKYSIIVPVYNVEKYIENCVSSVLKQTYGDFELLLVDDGSTDNSPLICDSLAEKDERIKVIHKQNGGVSSARNEGIRQAKGDYILFLDADDYFDVFLLENCLPYTCKNLKAFYFNYKFVYKDSDELIASKFNKLTLRSDKGGFKGLKRLVQENTLFIGVIWNGCYNREFLLDNNLFFNDKYVLSEDTLFNLILFIYLDEYLALDFVGYYYNRTNENSVCNLKRTSFDNFVQMSYDTYVNLQNRGIVFSKNELDFLFYFIIIIGNGWVAHIENTQDVKKHYLKFRVTKHKDFYKSFMKPALKNAPKIPYNEFRPHIFLKNKCYKALEYYSVSENKFTLKLRCFFINFTFPFVKLNARIKRRIKGLFKKSKND